MLKAYDGLRIGTLGGHFGPRLRARIMVES